MKILIVKLSAIGDVVHSLPVLYALRQKFPSAHIAWLVEGAASSLLEGHPLLDRLLISRRKSWLSSIRRDPNRVLSEIRHFVKELRDTQYDIILDLHALLKSGLLIALSRGGRKVGYAQGDEFSSIFLNERVASYDLDKHAVLRYMNLAVHLGAEPDVFRFPIPITHSDRESLRKILKKEEITAPFVAFNPVAKWESKLWDTDKFAILADYCIKELGLSVVFTGSKTDKKEVSLIMSRMKGHAVSLCGKTNLRELAYAYTLSAATVTTDTGPMHIAAAVEAPVIALFGPTAPWRTGPFGQGHKVIRKNLPCSPCFRKKCPELKCMKGIEVEEVIAAIAEQMQIQRAGSLSDL